MSSRKRHLDEVRSSSERRKPKVTQPQRLHYGLYNQGATCYLNSVLQVLFMTTDFHTRLDPKSKFTDKELWKIFEKLKETTCGTENITKVFEIRDVHQQSDAAECLELILYKVSPQASKVFQGELTYSTKCSEGHIINDESNPFWTLPLPLKDTSDSTFSVEHGFERIFETTKFSGDNMVYCNECKRKTEATSRCEMTEFPPNLILLLKRFDIDYSTMSQFKSDCCVEVPHVLQTKNIKYKLYGMVNHMGSVRSGHYTATVLSEDNTWYELNDDYVKKVKEPFAQTRTHSSRTAYLLLYRASKSQRDEGREGQAETGHLEPQMGHKGGESREKMSSRKRHLDDVLSSSERRKQIVTQPQRLHYGLYNQGATCYLNSVLQVLFTTTDFHNRLDPKSKVTDKELRNIFKKLKETTCGTENIEKAFEIRDVNQQSDVAECLELILYKVSPRASKVFQGELTYSTKCSEGHIINDESNPFWTLPLPLKDTRDSTFSVEHGFKRIFETTKFSGDNMVYCNECKRKTEATSRCEMTEFPPNLILLLKRFDIDYSTMSQFKSDCCVEVPHVLQTKNKTYKLYGMVNHMGTVRSGHYTATVLSEDNTWYECNDDYVKKVKEPFAQTRTHSSRTAYLLLYRASGSQRDEGKERQAETGHLDPQMGHIVENKRQMRESEKPNRQAQDRKESRGGSTKAWKGQQKHGRTDSSIPRDQYSDPEEEFSLLPKIQATGYPSKHHPDSRAKPDKRTQMDKKEKDLNSEQPCKRLPDILKNPWVIGAIIVVGVLALVAILIPSLLRQPIIIDKAGNP